MFDFCHHCGNTIGQNQEVGQTLVCTSCGETIGVVSAPKPMEMIDKLAEVIQSGAAARCALCSQAVQVKVSGGVRSYVPHFVAGGPRKMCPNSGKPVPTDSVAPAGAATTAALKAPPPPPQRKIVTPSGKDLSAHMNREVIRVVAGGKGSGPTIEQLTLEYLDRSDRVRIQIDALRDILGAKFQMNPYPAPLKRPHLAVWSTPSQCVVACKHERGGIKSMSDAEVLQVVEELRQHGAMFWPA